MLNLALVGCGGFANIHAQNLTKLPDCRVAVLCDINEANRKQFKQKYFPEAAEASDFNELLKYKPVKLDAVVLCTPHTLHYPQSKAALEHGLNVLTEKPMVTSSPDAYDLWRTVKRTGKQLGISFQAPYSAEYQYLKQLRQAGTLGKVQIVQGWLAQGWLNGTIGTWRQDPSLSGGGQMYDSGSHILNGIMWLMDEPVIEVCCMIDNCGSPVDINGVAILKFRSGAMGSIAIGGNSPGWNVDIRLQTDKLQARTGPHGGYLEITGNPALRYPHVVTDDAPAAFTSIRNFTNALLGRETIQAPARYGVLLSALMDAMYESARLGRSVSVAPVPDDLD